MLISEIVLKNGTFKVLLILQKPTLHFNLCQLNYDF